MDLACFGAGRVLVRDIGYIRFRCAARIRLRLLQHLAFVPAARTSTRHFLFGNDPANQTNGHTDSAIHPDAEAYGSVNDI